MCGEKVRTDDSSEGRASAEKGSKQRGTGFSAMASCCGSMAPEEGRGCPCTSFFEKHRVAVFATLSALGLALLTIPLGAVLGIIAFFRTF